MKTDESHSLPAEKGTYVLISSVTQLHRLAIGRLGTFDILPGYYAYVGSAHGAGGLRARLLHHLESAAAPHWHIDYLLTVATPVEAWYAVAEQKLEHHWAELLHKTSFLREPISRFGASDYRRSRGSHLYFSKKPLSFLWFKEKIRQTFQPGLLLGRIRLADDE